MLDVAPRGNGAVTPFVVQPEVLPGNGLLSTLANAITAVATTLNIQAGDAVNWPSSGVYRAVICQDPINGPWELVMVTGGQGSSTLQVTRAAESYNGNTTAYAWPVGTSISAVLTQAGLTAWRGAGGGGGTDVASYFRSTGPGTLPTTGVGTEMFYQGTVQPTSAYTGSFYPHDYDPAGKAVMSSTEMNIGLSFTVDVACTLQAITFFRSDPPTQDVGPTSHNFGLYNAGTQALLWSGWTNGEVDYWNPISVGYALQPGVTYMAVVHISAANGVYQRDASFLGTAGNIWPGPVPMHYVSSSTGSYATLAFPSTTLATPDGMGLDVVISGPPASSGFQAYGAWFDPNISGNRNNSEGGQGANGGLAFTVTQPCLLTQVRWFRPTQDTDATSRPMALYDRRTPGTPLWTGSTSAEVAGQWNTVAVPSISLQPGVPYMLAWHLFPNSYWRDVWQYYTPFARGPLQIEAGFLDDSWPNLVCPVYYFGQDFMGADLVVSVAQQNRAVVQTYDHAAGAPGPLEIDASALTLNAQTVVAPNGLQIGTFARQSTLFFAGPNPDVTGNEVPDMSYAVSVAQSRRNGSYLSVRTAGTGGVYTDWSTLAVCGWTGGDSASGSNPAQTWKGSGGRIYLSKNGDLDYGGSMVLDSSGNINVNSTNGQNKSTFYINIDSYTVLSGQWYGGGTFLYANLPAYVNVGYTQYPSPSQPSVALAVGNNGLTQDSTANTAYGVYTLVGPNNSTNYNNLDLSIYYARAITNSAVQQASSVRGLFVDTPTFYSGTVFRNTYGVFIANQSPNTAGTQVNVGCYGVYVAPQSGVNADTYGVYIEAPASINGNAIGLYNAGTSRFDGTVSIGFDPQRGVGLTVMGTWLDGGTNYGIWNQPTFGGSADGFGMYVQTNWQAGTSSYQTGGIKIDYPSMNGGSIYNSYGIYIGNPGGTGGITNAYGIFVNSVANASSTNIGIYNGATTALYGNVGIGTNPVSQYSLLIATSNSVGDAIYIGNTTIGYGTFAQGIYCQLTANNTVTNFFYGASFALQTTAATYSLSTMAGIYLYTPSLGSGSSVNTSYGVYIQNQGKAGITNAYGVYIAAQSGASSTNIGLYNAASSALWGVVGILGQPSSAAALQIGNVTALTGATQWVINMNTQFTSAATTSMTCISTAWWAANGTYSTTQGEGLHIGNPQLGTGQSVGTMYGINVINQGKAGVTAAYGVFIQATSGASSTNIGLYNAGTSQLQDIVGMGIAPNALYALNAALTTATANAAVIHAAITSNAVTGGSSAALIDGTTSASGFNTALTGLQVNKITITGSATITNTYGISVSSQGGAGISYAYAAYLAGSTNATTKNTTLWLGTPSGTGPVIIDSSVGAQLTTAGAWTNAPSWAAQKNQIRYVAEDETGRWFDWLASDHKPIRYRHPEIRNDAGEVIQFTPKGDYDHFGFLLDDVPQDIREVWCVNESGGLSTKDTEGFLLAMLKVSGQRIKTLEARLEALESKA